MLLSDTKIRKAKPDSKPRKLQDGNGLYLDLRPSGKKFWRYRFTLNKKESIYTIGEYPHISLSEARRERDRLKGVVLHGVNPNTLKQAPKPSESTTSFQYLADEYRNQVALNWSKGYLRQYDSVMSKDVLPILGKCEIAEIKPREVLVVLDSIKARNAPRIAYVAKMFISKIFKYAASKLIVDYDPTYVLTEVIPQKATQHFKTLPTELVKPFLRDLRAYKGRVTGWAIELLLHTFLRSNELRQVKWEYIDFTKEYLIIPSTVMKKRREHVVPLSKQSLVLIRLIEPMTCGSQFLFPHRTDPTKPMGQATMDRVIEHIGYRGQFSLHGFRSCASTVLNEHGWNTDLIELQLAHVERNQSRRAYNHAMHLGKRKEMMQWWSDYVEELASK